MRTLLELNPILDKLVDICLNGDQNENSFYIINNFEFIQKELPFLHKNISVSPAIEKILETLKNEALFFATIDKIKDSEEIYFLRNISTLLSEFYLETNNLQGIKSVIESYLIDEFKFHGYRHLLSYYSKNYDEEKFLEVFKKIEKRNRLNPNDRNAIGLFIEKYTEAAQDIELTKKMVVKNKLWKSIDDYLKPMLLGIFKNKPYQEYNLIDKIVETEIENPHDRFFIEENVLNSLYERTNNIEAKYYILGLLNNMVEKIPRDIKVQGYPSKLWTLILWRIGCKYVELNNRELTIQTIKSLSGKHKDDLKNLYNEKFNKDNH